MVCAWCQCNVGSHTRKTSRLGQRRLALDYGGASGLASPTSCIAWPGDLMMGVAWRLLTRPDSRSQPSCENISKVCLNLVQQWDSGQVSDEVARGGCLSASPLVLTSAWLVFKRAVRHAARECVATSLSEGWNVQTDTIFGSVYLRLLLSNLSRADVMTGDTPEEMSTHSSPSHPPLHAAGRKDAGTEAGEVEAKVLERSVVVRDGSPTHPVVFDPSSPATTTVSVLWRPRPPRTS